MIPFFLTTFFALKKTFDIGHRKMEEKKKAVCLDTCLCKNMSMIIYNSFLK